MVKQVRWVKRPSYVKKRTLQKAEDPYGSLSIFWSWGWRVALEWGAAVGVGAFLGACVDAHWHLDSFGLVIGLLLGSTAGVLNIYRSCQKYFEQINKKFSV